MLLVNINAGRESMWKRAVAIPFIFNSGIRGRRLVSFTNRGKGIPVRYFYWGGVTMLSGSRMNGLVR